MKRSALVLSLLALTPALLPAQVSVPLLMSYQGRVTDATGVGLGVGTPVNRKVLFRLYSAASGGTAIWTEEQTVTIADGEFSVLLGLGIQPVSGSAANAPHPSLDAAFLKSATAGTDRYLGITVDDGDGTIDGSDSELTPRQRLATSAFAIRAASADSVTPGADLQLNGSANQGLGWYGTDRTFNGIALDGPALYGAGGGVLGVVTNNGGTQTPVLRWDANGKVGIGTGPANLSTLTNTKLVVQGDDANATAQQLSIRGDTDNNKRLNLGFNTTSNLGVIQAWTSASTGTSLLLNPSGGNVGIGTTLPGARLDVNGSLKAQSLSVTDTLSTTGDLSTTKSVLAAGASGFRFTSGDNDGGLFSPADGVIQIKTDGSERMRFENTGATLYGTQWTRGLLVADATKYTTLNHDQLAAYNGTAKSVLHLNSSGGGVKIGESGGGSLGVNGAITATTVSTTGAISAGGGLSATGTISATGAVTAGTSITAGSSITSNGDITAKGRIYAAGNNGGYAFSLPGDTDGGLFSSEDGLISLRTNNVDKVWVTPEGRMGIGTSSPKASLDVQGGSSITNPTGGYWNINPPAVWTGGGGNTQTYSIRASNWILAQAYWTFSDERLKEKLGYSDSSADLDTMMKLKIADYRFKDKVENGAAEQKKVIAQDVEKVFPQAVTRSPGVIPDIFRKVPVDKDGWITLSANVKKGDQVRLIGKDGAASLREVLDATADKFQTDYKTTEAEVFVYGRQVDDLRTVDYEALAMLNISATQEIVHRLQAKSDEVTALNARLAALEARDKERDDKLALLEKLVLASQERNLEKDSAKPAARTVALQQEPQPKTAE